MPHTVRCPMRECRRSIDLEALPTMPDRPQPLPCLHYIASWGLGRSSMVEEVLFGLDGNRELIIRNVRPPEITAEMIDPERVALEAAAREFAREVAETTPDGSEMMWALFGDQYERDAASRTMAQLLIGPDPMISRVAG
ncbi:MAG: hypothetical protein DWI48_06375 [Chloroflexi bacterium]|nr:MAG: hypothetical protein DWI48_06375 [Chloroflexota bacterium]